MNKIHSQTQSIQATFMPSVSLLYVRVLEDRQKLQIALLVPQTLWLKKFISKAAFSPLQCNKMFYSSVTCEAIKKLCYLSIMQFSILTGSQLSV